ncbi:hypothetical protein BDQ12DRAFT_666545 [Crucibulum laeve]|uniref:DUF6699 domain-containing protein n=1 Tax=Crucibulum laeve TaxID=68775 RepID=A0A5C3M0S4_9AGAR|nr:hypothetical protein BDQ12DRAFT_666545 [Crucibulum laeve]
MAMTPNSNYSHLTHAGATPYNPLLNLSHYSVTPAHGSQPPLLSGNSDTSDDEPLYSPRTAQRMFPLPYGEHPVPPPPHWPVAVDPFARAPALNANNAPWAPLIQGQTPLRTTLYPAGACTPARRSSRRSTRSKKSGGNHESNCVTAILRSEEFNVRNLAKRPNDWRADYIVHPPPRPDGWKKLAGIFKHSPKPAHPGISFPHIDLVDCLRYTTQKHHPDTYPITQDLRNNPAHSPPFLNFYGVYMDHFYSQVVVSTPPTKHMRIFHHRLPWYIEIRNGSSDSITVWDFVHQIYASLNTTIRSADFYNDEMNADDREKLSLFFGMRCQGDPEQIKEGVKRVDYLGSSYMFIGLLPGPWGMWEMVTVEPNELLS